MTIAAATSWGAARMNIASDSPRLDAEVLLSFLFHRDRAWILTHANDELRARDWTRFRRLVAKRRGHWPVPYLTGRAEFFGFSLVVSPAVLIPRPATELLVQAILDRVSPNDPLRIADVGTGSGAIALALASRLPRATVIASDTSSKALSIARRNARHLGLRTRIIFRHGSLLIPYRPSDHLSIIVANLPYLTSRQLQHPSLRHEPRVALYGGGGGRQVLQQFIKQASAWPGVVGLGLELDPTQVVTVRRWWRTAWPQKTVTPISDGRKTRGLLLWTKSSHPRSPGVQVRS